MIAKVRKLGGRESKFIGLSALFAGIRQPRECMSFREGSTIPLNNPILGPHSSEREHIMGTALPNHSPAFCPRPCTGPSRSAAPAAPRVGSIFIWPKTVYLGMMFPFHSIIALRAKCKLLTPCQNAYNATGNIAKHHSRIRRRMQQLGSF